MKNEEDATKLANTMKQIGKLSGKETICVMTNMDQPLGKAVGNSLEVIEAVEFLKGTMEEDVKEVVFTLGAYMLKLAGKGNNIEENKKKLEEQIVNGKAFEKAKQWIANQGGDISYLEDVNKFQKAKYIEKVVATKQGYITKLDAKTVGMVSVDLGAGRQKKEDSIDMSAGIILEKKIGNKVEKGQTLAYIHTNDKSKIKDAVEKIQSAYEISANNKEEEKCILKII